MNLVVPAPAVLADTRLASQGLLVIRSQAKTEQGRKLANERRLAEYRRRRVAGLCVYCPPEKQRRARKDRISCGPCAAIQAEKRADRKCRREEPIVAAGEEIADAVRAAAFVMLRERRGISYEKLAREMGMSAAGVREWRRGTRIAPRHWKKLGKILGFNFAAPTLEAVAAAVGAGRSLPSARR